MKNRDVGSEYRVGLPKHNHWNYECQEAGRRDGKRSG